MSLPDGHIAVKLRIHGRVQGVWYRGWMVDEATALGLQGWVRNRADGTVEALAIGPETDVEALVAACQEGPPAARVERVEREPARGIAGSGFRQKPTV
jgi:acylphosphatase